MIELRLEDIRIKSNHSFETLLQVQECARTTMGNIEKTKEGGSDKVDIRKLVRSFTLDVISRVTCSVDFDSFRNWDSEAVKTANSPFSMAWFQLSFMFPSVVRLLNISFMDKKFKTYFENLAKTLMEQRKAGGSEGKFHDVLAVMSKGEGFLPFVQ